MLGENVLCKGSGSMVQAKANGSSNGNGNGGVATELQKIQKPSSILRDLYGEDLFKPCGRRRGDLIFLLDAPRRAEKLVS